MMDNYALVFFLSFMAARKGEAVLARPMPTPVYPVLSDDEILGITGDAKGIIRSLIESYLFDPDGIQTSQEKRNADMNVVKEQIKHLNCIFHPCLYGGLCEMLNIDSKFVTMEFGVELEVVKQDLGKEVFTEEATAQNFAEQQVAILRSLEDYFYRLESSASKAAFIKDHARTFVRCTCRPGSHPDEQCKGCGNGRLIVDEE